MTAAAIILAGGASRRMGTPKALLAYKNQTFLDLLVSIFHDRCSITAVVLGHQPQVIRAAVKSDALFLENPQWELGQLTSLQAGLRALPPVDSVFFTPVDYPAIPSDLPGLLLDALERSPYSSFAVPSFQGQHGHPVLFRASIITEFLDLPSDASARDVIHRYAGTTVYVDTPHAGVVTDVDEPGDYEALLQGSRL